MASVDITFVECNGIVVVSLDGAADDFVGEHFEKILKEKSSNCFDCGIIDLARIEQVTQSMVYAFLKLARCIVQRKGVLVFVGTPHFSDALTGAIGVANMFPIFSTYDAAMDYCHEVIQARESVEHTIDYATIMKRIEQYLFSQE